MMDEQTYSPARSAGSYLFTIIRLSLLFVVLCGIAYPLLCTGIAQALMPHRASGSLIQDGSGKTVGSELIGQKFADPHYFQGRVSSIDYKAEASGSSNYGPSNPDLLKRMRESIADWRSNNPDVPIDRLPIDLITNSGSGLDPHITPQSAQAQIPRISKLTGIPSDRLEQLVRENTEGRDLGLFGEERVNVLKINIALKELLGK